MGKPQSFEDIIREGCEKAENDDEFRDWAAGFACVRKALGWQDYTRRSLCKSESFEVVAFKLRDKAVKVDRDKWKRMKNKVSILLAPNVNFDEYWEDEVPATVIIFTAIAALEGVKSGS